MAGWSAGSIRSAPAAVEQPPGALLETYRFFLKPVKWLIVTTLVVSLVASVTELAMFAFLGSLVDRMAASSPERFVSDNLWLLVFMGFVLLVARPFFIDLVARARQPVDHAEPLQRSSAGGATATCSGRASASSRTITPAASARK